jgi:4-hydroxy-tetrahydrodipicolinate synthase
MKGVITAIVTPFLEDGSLDIISWEILLKAQEDASINGIVIGGTTGEGWSLEKEEVEKLFHIAKKHYFGKIYLGTGSNSTKDALLKTRQAKSLNADGALIVVPYYNLPTEEAVVGYYEDLSKVGIDIIVYHHPGRTGVTLSVEALQRISKIDHVVSLKETHWRGENLKTLCEKMDVYSGNDGEMKGAKRQGALGVISVISNLYPTEVKRFFESNELDHSWELKELLKKLFIEGSPSGLKWALAHKNLCQKHVRAPLLSLSKVGARQLEKELACLDCKEFANS